MLQAGFCRLDVTPPLGIDMPGYYTRRLSTGILDPLTVTAVALSDSSTQAVLITADFIGIPIPVQDQLKQAVSERCGISKDHSTHPLRMPSDWQVGMDSNCVIA